MAAPFPNNAPNPLEWFATLKWLDGRPLLETIEPYRRRLFEQVLSKMGPDGFPKYNRVLSGRAKKNFKTTDLILAALYRFLAWPSAGGNDCFIIANDEEQAADDLSLAKKLIAVNPGLKAGVRVLEKEIVRRDGLGRMKILPAGDAVGLHGKTFLFLGFDEIHGYRNYDLFEALSPDPTRRDVLIWITSYASVRHSEGIPLHDMLQAGKRGDDGRMLFSWYAGDYTTDPDFAGEEITPEVRANPSMHAWGGADYLEDQRKRLPNHKFRRLHLNLPGAPDGAAFNADVVLEAIVRSRRRLLYEARHQYFGFVDMSGGSSDDAVLAICHPQDGRGVVDLVECQAGGTPFDPLAAVKKFAALLKEYGLHRVTGDKFAGETFIQAFRSEGVSYEVSPLSRSQLYEAFAPVLNAGTVDLPDHARLQEQLLTLVVKSSGHIDHQAGDHDDFANAVAGAVVLAGREVAPSLIPASALRAKDDAPAFAIGLCRSTFATVWVGQDGLAGMAWWAVRLMPVPGQPELVLMDVATSGWSPAVLDQLAVGLDVVAEQVRDSRAWNAEHGVSAILWSQDQLVGLATDAMRRAFQSRLSRIDAKLGRREVGTEGIPAEHLRDPARLMLGASAAFGEGRIEFAPLVHERAKTVPVFGSLGVSAADDCERDPLRVALLLGIAIGLDAAPLMQAPDLGAARICFA